MNTRQEKPAYGHRRGPGPGGGTSGGGKPGGYGGEPGGGKPGGGEPGYEGGGEPGGGKPGGGEPGYEGGGEPGYEGGGGNGGYDNGGPGDGDGGCSTCNLEEIEQLTCTAKRFGKQAEVMNLVTPELEKFRNWYADARQKYTAARDAALPVLDAINKTLDELYEQLRCRLTDDQKDCLHNSAEDVFDDIAECSDPMGCHSPCDDTPGPDPDTQTDIAALIAEIARRRGNLTESAAYFTTLIGEPDAITKRVEGLKADSDLLYKDVTTGGDGSKVASWYARWLIIKHWATLDRIGHGFGSVTEYLDCLCGVLKCLVSGWTTVAILEGRQAELECYATAKELACQKKKDDTLDAILDAYEECCKDKDSGEVPSDDYEQQPQEAAG